MTHSEDLNPILNQAEIAFVFAKLQAKDEDAFILFQAPQEDIKTAVETIEERCKMAFKGVPEETRKSFEDGTTIFERVLPGADRMYPDTDSAPIPLTQEYIESIRLRIPNDIIDRYKQLSDWKVPKDTYTYLFSKNLYPLFEKIVTELGIEPKFIGKLLGQQLKNIEGHYTSKDLFDYQRIYDLLAYLQVNAIDLAIAEKALIEFYQHPKMDFDSIMLTIGFKRLSKEHIASQVMFLREKYQKIGRKQGEKYEHNWIMGQLHHQAKGNWTMRELSEIIKQKN